MQTHQPEFHDQLLRGLTHKMNNYLTLFQGYLGVLLEDEKLRPETLEGLDRIQTGATAAGELLERIQMLVHPSSRIWREIDLVRFMDSLKAQLERMGTGTTVKVTYPDHLPPVLADPGRLRSALFELVKNACEAASEDGIVNISVTGDPDLPEPTKAQQVISWVEFRISDNGPGIPAAIQGKILQPFFTTRARTDATGLGLTQANELIQQMNGQLRFESIPGETIFRLLLPAKTQRY